MGRRVYYGQPPDEAAGPQRKIISQCIDSVGDGTGTVNLIGDYSSGQTTFKIAPAAGEIYRLSRMLGYIEDAGTFDTGAYGNAITLTNGIEVEYDYDGAVVDLLGGQVITTNGGWAAQCYDVIVNTYGTGNEFLSFRWTFQKSGQYIRLNGDDSEELRILLHDDFTGLVTQRFLIQGYIE